MTFTPPFTLTGEAGKALGNVGYSLAALGVQDAVLSLRSLDVDTLTFSLRDNGNRPAIPDDGQWLTLKDDAGQVLFTGIAKRSFRFPERIYTYEISNVYQGMMETNLLSNGRPFITYFADDAVNILTDLLERAGDVGLAVQTGAMPALFTVPKMSFRASSYAGAIEDALKWLPDVTSNMDYSTTPPTLLFHTRASAAEKVIDLDRESHKATALELTPYPELRALAVDFSYAKRQGDRTIEVLSQSAGDPDAAGMRKISLFISGAERMDAFIAESLVTAMDAKEMALKLGAIDPAQSKSLVLNWDWLKAAEPNIAAAIVQQPNFTMYLATPVFTMNNGYYDGFGSDFDSYTTRTSTNGIRSAKLSETQGGTAVVGWWPITAAAAAEWNTADLASVGVTKKTGWYSNDLFWDSRYHANVMTSAGLTYLNGFSSNRRDAYWNYNSIRSFWWRTVPIPVTIINALPSTVEQLLAANNPGFSLDFIKRAEYVDVPPDLAANYFARQDWTPYKGSLTLAPSAPDFPAPGDFLSVRGEGLPTEWETMKIPVAELALDLRTGVATVAIGPSPRMDFSSLVDRLRIPPEDNYQAG